MKLKLPKGLDVEELRWRRDLAQRDGDFRLAFECALAIDKIKYGKPKRAALSKAGAV